MALNFAGMVVMARLVAPHDFGVFAVASSIVLLAAYLAEIGASWALTQRSRIRADHVGSALVLGAGGATAISLVVTLAGEVIASWMRMPELQDVLLVMCWVIPVQAASGVPRALLRRAMNFGPIVRADLLAAATGLAVGLVHATLSPSVVSLLLQAITYQVVLALGLWLAGKPAKVGLPTRQGLRELLVYAGAQTLYEALIMASKNVDTFLIARMMGAAPLGLYSRSFALVFTPLGQVYTAVGAVAFSAMSRHQTDLHQLRLVHRKFLLASAAGLAFPLAVFSAFGTDFVVVILGEPWRSSGTVLSVLAIAAALQVLYANLLWVLQATAQMKVQVFAGALLALVNVTVFVGATSTGKLWHFAGAYVIGTMVAMLSVARVVLRTVNTSAMTYFAGLLLVVAGIPLGHLFHWLSSRVWTSELGTLVGLLGTYLVVACIGALVIRRRY